MNSALLRPKSNSKLSSFDEYLILFFPTDLVELESMLGYNFLKISLYKGVSVFP